MPIQILPTPPIVTDVGTGVPAFVYQPSVTNEEMVAAMQRDAARLAAQRRKEQRENLAKVYDMLNELTVNTDGTLISDQPELNRQKEELNNLVAGYRKEGIDPFSQKSFDAYWTAKNFASGLQSKANMSMADNKIYQDIQAKTSSWDAALKYNIPHAKKTVEEALFMGIGTERQAKLYNALQGKPQSVSALVEAKVSKMAEVGLTPKTETYGGQQYSTQMKGKLYTEQNGKAVIDEPLIERLVEADFQGNSVMLYSVDDLWSSYDPTVQQNLATLTGLTGDAAIVAAKKNILKDQYRSNAYSSPDYKHIPEKSNWEQRKWGYGLEQQEKGASDLYSRVMGAYTGHDGLSQLTPDGYITTLLSNIKIGDFQGVESYEKLDASGAKVEELKTIKKEDRIIATRWKWNDTLQSPDVFYKSTQSVDKSGGNPDKAWIKLTEPRGLYDMVVRNNKEYEENVVFYDNYWDARIGAEKQRLNRETFDWQDYDDVSGVNQVERYIKSSPVIPQRQLYPGGVVFPTQQGQIETLSGEIDPAKLVIGKAYKYDNVLFFWNGRKLKSY